MGTFSHVHFNAMSGAGVAAQAILSNEKESLRWERAHDILSQEESYVATMRCALGCATREAEIWRGINILTMLWMLVKEVSCI